MLNKRSTDGLNIFQIFIQDLNGAVELDHTKTL